jgi:DNA polymerase
MDLVEPELVVLLGATAVRSMAPSLRVMRDRGVLHDREVAGGVPSLVTVRPSAVLRAQDRTEAMAAFVADLRVAADHVHSTRRWGR